jgi:hypothetical protein
MPDVVRWLLERRALQLVMAASAGDRQMTHNPADRGCFLSAPIARTFARMLSVGSQTTYSRMKVKVVGGGEQIWQGTMLRAMRSKNGERRWHHWVRRTLPPFILGNLGFSR